MKIIGLSALSLYFVVALIISFVGFFTFYDYWSVVDYFTWPGGIDAHQGEILILKAEFGYDISFIDTLKIQLYYPYLSLLMDVTRPVAIFTVDNYAPDLFFPITILIIIFLIIALSLALIAKKKTYYVVLAIVPTAVITGYLLSLDYPMRPVIIDYSNRPELLNIRDKKSLSLLQEGKYQELEDMLNMLRVRYESKIGDPYEYLSPIEDIELYGSENLLDNYDAWVSEFPDSYHAHLIRGMKKVRMAYKERGTKYFSETPKSNIESMQALYDDAINDLEKALSINPASETAYKGLIEISAVGDYHRDRRDLFSESKENVGPSYLILDTHIHYLQQKWGGRPGEIHKIGKSLRLHTNLDPRFIRISGEQLFYDGWSVIKGEDEESLISMRRDAVEYYKLSLFYGANSKHYRRIVNIYDLLGEEEQSMSWLYRCAQELSYPTYCFTEIISRKVEQKDRVDLDVYLSRLSAIPSLTDWELSKLAEGYYYMKKYQDAQTIFMCYMDRHPDSYYALWYLYQMSYRGKTNDAELLPYFTKGVTLNPDNFRLLMMYASMLEDQNPQEAVKVFSKILESDHKDKSEADIEYATKALAELRKL